MAGGLCSSSNSRPLSKNRRAIISIPQLICLAVLATRCEGQQHKYGHGISGGAASFVPLTKGHIKSCSKSSNGKRICSSNPHLLHAEECGTKWSPRSRYWVKDELFQQEEIIQLGVELEASSLNESGADSDHDNMDSSSPVVTTIHRNKVGNAIAVEVASAISYHQMEQMRTLSYCVKKQSKSAMVELGEHFENRSFGDGKGGNDCTYLAPLLQAFCPDVAAQVVEIATLAWSAASWDKQPQDQNQSETCHPDPMSLGIRTSEHLSYKGWRSLEAHKDIGSIYTIMISVKDPTKYDGGEFFLHNSIFDSTDVKLEQFSAIVFLSNTIHGVRPITSGHRESFVTELWTEDDSPIGMCRPTEEQWEKFMLPTVGSG